MLCQSFQNSGKITLKKRSFAIVNLGLVLLGYLVFA